MLGRKGVCGLIVLALGMLSAPVHAALSGTSTISPTQLGPNLYKYTLSLTNNGSSPISTFWFGWLPGYDLLPSHPNSVTGPAGWTGVDAGDIYGIGSAQWYNAATPLQPGQTLGGFVFTTPDSPNVLAQPSFFGIPSEESYLYSTSPPSLNEFTDPTFAFVPATVAAPEPASLSLLAAASGLLLIRRGKRQRI